MTRKMQHSSCKGHRVLVKQLTEDEFSGLEKEWQELLLQTSSDQLFLSWYWMHQWWRQCANPNHDELLLICAYDGNKLVGIAPLYKSRQKFKYNLSTRRILFIGTNPNGHETFRAEYLEFIAHPDYLHVVDELLDYLSSNFKYSEIYFQDLLHNSPTLISLVNLTGYKRMDLVGESFSIDTSNGFEDYLSGLGKHTRKNCFGQRKRLQNMGQLEISQVNPDEISTVFDLLYEFQKERWGLDKNSLKLKQKFVENISAASNIKVSGIVMSFNNEPVACTFDLIVGVRVYNLQLAFKQGFNKRFSLGYLVAVLDAERCFEEPLLQYYDLLEGGGKNYNYKIHLASPEHELITVSIINDPVHKLLYRVYDYIKHSYRVIREYWKCVTIKYS